LGKWEWDPSVDHPSDVGESHLRGDCWKSSVSDNVSHRLEMVQTLDI